MAFFNVRSNKVRAFLTMLGIIIGVSSVVAVLSIGNGVTNWITGSLSGIAGSYFEIYVSDGKEIPASVMDNLVEKYDSITGYSEILGFRGTAQGLKKEENLTINCGRPQLEKKGSGDIIYGRYFNETEWRQGRYVCVMDTNGAEALFGTQDATGKTLNIVAYGRELSLKVVGVRKAPSVIEGLLLYGGGSLSIDIPSTLLIDIFGFELDPMFDAIVFVDSPDHAVEMSVKARKFIEAAMDERGENKIRTYELNSGVSEFKTIIGGVTAFVMLVAGISLFVGGVGVMNIMLVSVTERTREIGIRKSLGARTGSILWQFLIESGLISLTGGVIGIIMGYLFSILVSLLVKKLANIAFVPEFNIVIIIVVSLVSAGIGIFFGWYPAKKAAHLTPIEALRA